MLKKRCPKCGEDKDTKEFSRNAGRPDGLSGWCKLCMKPKITDWRKTTGKQALVKSTQKARAKYPEKYKARTIYSNAVAKGDIVRPDRCSRCNEPCIPEGHHTDYSKPLDVVWLCRNCHAKEHNDV